LKTSWNVLKEISGQNIKTHAKSEFTVNNRTITNDQEIADAFNNYFVNIGPKLVSQMPQSTANANTFLNHAHAYPSAFFTPATSDEVHNIIKQLKSASPGYDNITLSILKHIWPVISTALTHLINLSLQTGIVPDELKIAKVIPIYKSNDPSQLNNYRPISVLPLFSKLFERIAYTRLEKHLILHEILSPYQFGFRKNHSTSMAVSSFVEHLYDILENQKFAIATFLDLSKAFDLVDHTLLLHKLSHYGIRGITLDWFKSYLTNRKQFVKFKLSKSSMQAIQCGVPQGSILGPLLFLVYINDLPQQCNSLHVTLYADDTSIVISGDNVAETTRRLNDKLARINNWFTSNKLIINTSKTNYMVLSTKPSIQNSNFNVKLNNSAITRVHQTKFLGVIIDSKLTWQHHIMHIKNKISKIIGILHRVRRVLPTKALVTLYNALILPHLTYCVTVWGNTYKTHLHQLMLTHKKIIRIITHSTYLAHTAPLFKRHKILTLVQLHKFHSLMFAYKLYHFTLPNIITATFNPPKPTRPPYSLRNSTNVHLPCNRKLTVSRFGLKYNVSFLWNSLPHHLKNLPSLFTFKKHVKSQITENAL
jgi:hypothetical protein